VRLGGTAEGLIFGSATGVVVRGLLGGLAGGLIGNAMESQTKDQSNTAQDYNYASTQGTIVHIEKLEIEPASIRRGERVNLIAHYALLTPDPDQRVSVTEQQDISRDGQPAGNPTHTVQRPGGTWASTVPLTLPRNARTGTYRVALTVQARDVTICARAASAWGSQKGISMAR